MCGICGFINFDTHETINPSDIKKMMNAIKHRGPDGSGFYVSNNLALGFNRLSIIDLEGGMQPISNETNDIIMVCNGEIFNYLDLKESLILKGHKFKSKTDIEVILHLYEEYDIDFINKLNGQFAFFLYDKKKNISICARDHFGIAPFFYTKTDNTFVFASEIKSILEYSKVKKEVNLVGLDQLFTFPGLISPTTMFKNIFSLENGHMLVINEEGHIKNIEYFDLIYPEKDQIEYRSDQSYYINKLNELLTRSIKLRLKTDVPIGLYISGGLDSSIIAAITKELYPNIQWQTFSIDFEQIDISEDRYQQMIVDQIGSVHNKRIFSIDDIIQRLKMAVYHSETPLKESYNTASYCLSSMVRNKGIKSILSGEGSDEIFGGYVGYKFDKMRELRKNITYRDKRESILRETIWGDENFFYEKDYYQFTETKLSIYYQDLVRNYESINCLNHFIVDTKKLKNRDILHKRSYVDFKLRLVDHLISDHCDRMTYANSVEGRYPFLDRDIFSFILTVPPYLKLNEFEEKYILKQMSKKYLPKEIINREKFGFVAPGSVDIIKSNNEYINYILSYDTIKRQGYFNPKSIESLKSQYKSAGFKLNLPYDSDLLIIVLTFGIFLDVFNLS